MTVPVTDTGMTTNNAAPIIKGAASAIRTGSSPQEPLLLNTTWIATLALIMRVNMKQDGTKL